MDTHIERPVDGQTCLIHDPEFFALSRLSSTGRASFQWTGPHSSRIGCACGKHHRTLQWRHNERCGVSNHRRPDYLLNCLFRRRSKKTSKLRFTGLCVGIHRWPVNSPHKGPVTQKMFPFDDVIMDRSWLSAGWIFYCFLWKQVSVGSARVSYLLLYFRWYLRTRDGFVFSFLFLLFVKYRNQIWLMTWMSNAH